MKNILTIINKELKSYFNSPIAYIFLTIFLAITNWFFFRTFFLNGQADMRGYFRILPMMFLFFIPAVSMRVWAEEKKLGTIELLLTLPIKDYEAVIGKYIASFIFVTLAIILSFPLVITVASLGNPDFGPIIGGYVGAILLGASYLAIGTFMSSLSENQINAFILGIISCFLLFIIGDPFVLMKLPYWLTPLLSYVSLSGHFESIARGVIDSRDIIYYVSFIFLFIYFTNLSIESRKWR